MDEDLEKELKYWENRTRMSPNYAYAWSKKGEVLGELGRFKEALVCHNKALQIEPISAHLWSKKGLTLAKSGSLEEALKSVDRALKMDSKNAEALSSKGFVLAKMGKVEEALEYYDKALGIDPKNADIISAKKSLESKKENEKKLSLIEIVSSLAPVYGGKIKLDLLAKKVGCDKETLEDIIVDLCTKGRVSGWEIDTLLGALKVTLKDAAENQPTSVKAPKTVSTNYSCFNCGTPIKATDEKCSSCGFEIVRCGVCKLPISTEDEMETCINCEAEFHKNHLLAWIQKEGKCPNCGSELKEKWYTP